MLATYQCGCLCEVIHVSLVWLLKMFFIEVIISPYFLEEGVFPSAEHAHPRHLTLHLDSFQF